jgi:hypothetical protein
LDNATLKRPVCELLVCSGQRNLSPKGQARNKLGWLQQQPDLMMLSTWRLPISGLPGGVTTAKKKAIDDAGANNDPDLRR